MAETDAEHGQAPHGGAHERFGDARILRPSGTRRDDEALCPRPQDAIDINRVVPVDRHLGSEFLEIMIQIVGEAVVVIDQNEHGPYLLRPQDGEGTEMAQPQRQRMQRSRPARKFLPILHLMDQSFDASPFRKR